MIELSGRYNSAKIFTDTADETSLSQVLLLLNQEFTAGSRIRMMPISMQGPDVRLGRQ